MIQIQGHETKQRIFTTLSQAMCADGTLLVMTQREINKVLKRPPQLEQSLLELVFEGFLTCSSTGLGKVYSLSVPSIYLVMFTDDEPDRIARMILANDKIPKSYRI